MQCAHSRPRGFLELERAIEAEGSLRRRRTDPESQSLIGSKCPRCGATSWPARAVCHACSSPTLLEVTLASGGSLLSYTTVWVERDGISPPFVLGQVRLDDGTLLYSHVRGLEDDRKVPLRVKVVVSGPPQISPAFWFEPAPAAGP